MIVRLAILLGPLQLASSRSMGGPMVQVQQQQQQTQRAHSAQRLALGQQQTFSAAAAARQPTVMNPSTSTSTNPNINININSGPQAQYVGRFGAARGPVQLGGSVVGSRGPQAAHQIEQPASPAICHLPAQHSEEWRSPAATSSKCQNIKDSVLKMSAINELKGKLDESSMELRQLLANYLNEFRTLSLGLVLVARNETLNRLRANLVMQQQGSPMQLAQAKAQFESTRRLFDSMYAHLFAHNPGDLGHSSALWLHHHHWPLLATDLNQEIGAYFKRLHVIQLKRTLEERLAARPSGAPTREQQPDEEAAAGWQAWMELDLDCLENNLASQQRVEWILAELSQEGPNEERQKGPAGQPMAAIGPGGEFSMSWLQLEQTKLSLSMRQSFEFARTLLSSLSLSHEMFTNLTRFTEDWMPSQSCHSALTRMSVCQQCAAWPTTATGAPAGPPTPHGPPLSQVGVPLAPCENYCLNVARGCMNDLFELNRFWSEHLSALNRFKSNMIQANNIENVMYNLEPKLVNFMSKLEQQYSTRGALHSKTFHLPQSAREVSSNSFNASLSMRVFQY